MSKIAEMKVVFDIFLRIDVWEIDTKKSCVICKRTKNVLNARFLVYLRVEECYTIIIS